MPRRSRNAYLWDIVDASRAIADGVLGRTYADFEQDRMFRRAIERELTIVGEAVSQMTRTYPETRDAIGPVRRLVGFRNVLIHEYGDVKNDVVWAIVVDEVPQLLERCQALLNKEQ